MTPAAPRNPKSLHLSAPVSLQLAEPRADSPTTELPASFEGTLYAGDVVQGYGAIIDLSSVTLLPRLPLLDSHGRAAQDIIGLVENGQLSTSGIRVSGKLFSDIPGSAAAHYAERARRGVPLQLSAGAFGFREEWLPKGATATVNGRTVSGPLAILRDATIREASLCTLGADWSAAVQLFSEPEPEPGPAVTTATDQNRGADMPTIEELQAQLAEANTKLSAATAESEAAKRAAEAAAKAARDTEISALFAECGTKGTDGERKALAALEAPLFKEMADAMRARAKAAGAGRSALFTEQATGDAGAQGAPTGAAAATKAAEAFLSDPGFYAKRDEARRKALVAAGGFAT